MELRLGPAEQAVFEAIGHRLRAHGWAAHLTVGNLLHDWQELTESADWCVLTVGDYTNDLTGRDALEIVFAECQDPLRSKVWALIEEADKKFLARTQEDIARTLPHHFQIREPSGWWWKRRPATGPSRST